MRSVVRPLTCTNHPGDTVRGVAADLGIVRGTLQQWLDVFGTGKKTAAGETSTLRPLHPAGEYVPVRRLPLLHLRVKRLYELIDIERSTHCAWSAGAPPSTGAG
jgi:transposase-like protein